MKLCPFCKESVQDEAVYCKHCHRNISFVFVGRLARVVIVLIVIVAGVFAYNRLNRNLPLIKQVVGEVRYLIGYLSDMKDKAIEGEDPLDVMSVSSLPKVSGSPSVSDPNSGIALDDSTELREMIRQLLKYMDQFMKKFKSGKMTR
ncbi:MAG: hypothetical protein PHH49_03465 [Candidatus Omnitrophica bacterium]|nr:hypothetical protein [Candidatus Omnitrophota bacterium]MDD5488007.1 hypothetical protein [Candidatus Omnitrophota bacterium]